MTTHSDFPPMTGPSLNAANALPHAVRRWRPSALALMIAVGTLGSGVLALSLRGTGVWNGVLMSIGLRPQRLKPGQVPLVITKEISPRDCSTGVDPSAPIILPLSLPNGSIDRSTLSDQSVSLFRFDNRQRVPVKVTFTNNAIRVQPAVPLEPNRNYRVHLLPGVKDVAGRQLKQMSMAFFTSTQVPAGIAYEKVTLPGAQGSGGYSPGKGDPNGFDAGSKTATADHDDGQPSPSFSEGFTGLEWGPDGKLYACTDHGKIVRWEVQSDGQLTNRETFTTLPDNEGADRLVTGFCFSPDSTPGSMTIYVTHSEYGFGFPKPVTDFTGGVSRLSGPKFEKYEPLVINLPRSSRDHATNQPHFGPDGALYIPQPSSTATGGADLTWAMRREHLLSATILRLDVTKLTPGKPLDAMTYDVDTFNDLNGNGKQDPDETQRFKGSYDPAAPGAPLTIYASGLRMPYDLLWHSNGKLYTAVNGASGGGATPAGPGVPAIGKVSITEHDWLFRVDRPGQYFGHPNPAQGSFVLNGGNPTDQPDFNEVSDYPVGTRPDSTWTPAIYDLGGHVSANGTVELKSNAFGGALKGRLIICRFSYYQDLLILGLDANGDVNSAITAIPGTTGLEQPLDILEDPRNGNLYVCEFGAARGNPPRITLLRPISRDRVAATENLENSGHTATATDN